MTEDEARTFYYWFRAAGMKTEGITEVDGEPGVRIWAVGEGKTWASPVDLWNTPRPGNKSVAERRSGE